MRSWRLGTLALLCVALSWASSSASHVRASPQARHALTFVGTSPCDAAAKQLLGIPRTRAGEIVKWKLRLHLDEQTGAASSFELTCEYGILVQGSLELRQNESLKRTGCWRIARGTAADSKAVVYELTPDGGSALSFQRIGADLLHLLDEHGRPMVGNAGRSYTLNRTGTNPRPGPALNEAAPSEFQRQPGSGAQRPLVMAYVGRSPGVTPEHPKLKWEITLYRNTQTLEPTSFRIQGTLFRSAATEGRWRITRGAAVDPDAVVYELEQEDGTMLRLLKLDERVLMFLDKRGEPRVGTDDFSFTLNRAETRPSVQVRS